MFQTKATEKIKTHFVFNNIVVCWFFEKLRNREARTEGKSCTSLGHEMFMLLHGKTHESADRWSCKCAAFRSADYTQPRWRMTIVALEIKCRISNHHITNKCTNCMSFILNHFFKTLSLLLLVILAWCFCRCC